MARIIYGRSKSLLRPTQQDRPVRSFDDLFDLLLNELLADPDLAPRSRSFLDRRHEPLTEDLNSRVIHEGYQVKVVNRKGESSTHHCSCCGMRFSANLMKDGRCHNCSSQRRTGPQDRGRSDRGVRAAVSATTLTEAYQMLGCDERDSDEIIKRRHRELAKEFHADRLSKGTSPEGIYNANERFCRAQEAYEIVMVARKKGI